MKKSADDMLEVATSIVGSRYLNSLSADFLQSTKNKVVILEREPLNEFDRNAIKCIVDGTHIGYIERNAASIISRHLEYATKYTVTCVGPKWSNVKVEIILGVNDPELKKKKYKEEKNEIINKVNQLYSRLIVHCKLGSTDSAREVIGNLQGLEISKWYYLSKGEPVFFAAESNNAALVALLVEAGFKYNDDSYIAFRRAICSNREEVINYFMTITVSAAGNTYALKEAYYNNNNNLVRLLAKRKLDTSILGEWLVDSVSNNEVNTVVSLMEYKIPNSYVVKALMAAVQIDQEEVTSLLLRQKINDSDLGEVLLFATKRGAVCSMRMLLDTISDDILIQDAISISIVHEKIDSFKVLMEKSSLVNQLELAFLQAVALGKVELAIELHGMGAYFGRTDKLAIDLLDSTKFNKPIMNITLQKLYELIPRHVLLEVLPKLATKKQLQSFLFASKMLPLEAAVLVSNIKLRDYCIREYCSNKLALYKRCGQSSQRALELMEFSLCKSELPASIVKKLENYCITNVLDLSLCSEGLLRDLVGLGRVEINEVLYFQEDNNYLLSSKVLSTRLDYPTLEAPLAVLGLSGRCIKSLVSEGIYTVGDLIKLTGPELMKSPGLGAKSHKEICNSLSIAGLSLMMS